MNELLQQVDPLQLEAMQWFVQLQGNADDRALHSEFEVWINKDPSHNDAYVAVQHLWDVSVEAPEARQAYRRYTRRQFVRKTALAGGAGLAVAGGIFTLIDRHPFAKYQTATGERRTVELPDGSSMELSTRTALTPTFNAKERRVYLHEGEAYFKVVRDRMARPFIVDSAAGQVTALGTEFSVATSGNDARVAVTEHAVRVDTGKVRGEVLTGQSLFYGPWGQHAVASLNSSVLAWRSGRLEFVSAPLGDVVRTIDQWRAGTTFFSNPKLANLRVTLLTDLSHVVESFKELPSILPVRMVDVTPLLTVIYPA
jgi:transmembrane sensor